MGAKKALEKITAGSGGGSADERNQGFFWSTVHVIFDQWRAEIDDRRGPRGEKRVGEQLPRGGALREGRQAALEEGKVTPEDTFHCPGYKMVEDRKIRCHKTQGHGAETFREGVMNSCNPVFMEIGARVGAERMLYYYKKLGLYEKTGVDLPGEAGSIMHKLENIGAVELATMSFGQSIQITPLQLLRAVSAVVNGGTLVTPHFAVRTEDSVTGEITELTYETEPGNVSETTSETMRSLLEAVVSEGTGKNARVEGYQVGGKTATSEKLPRGTGKYISSFLGFAPADHPEIMGLILIDEPVGVYYGGTIAAPVMAEIFQNILPYLDNI